MRSQVGGSSGGLLEINAPGDASNRYFGLFGPYVNLGEGRYRVVLKLSVNKPHPDGVEFDICCDGGAIQLSSRHCTPADFGAGLICGEISVSKRITDLEVRLNVRGGFVGTVERVSIIPLD
jgi:hypothetical protein